MSDMNIVDINTVRARQGRKSTTAKWFHWFQTQQNNKTSSELNGKPFDSVLDPFSKRIFGCGVPLIEVRAEESIIDAGRVSDLFKREQVDMQKIANYLYKWFESTQNPIIVNLKTARLVLLIALYNWFHPDKNVAVTYRQIFENLEHFLIHCIGAIRKNAILTRLDRQHLEDLWRKNWEIALSGQLVSLQTLHGDQTDFAQQVQMYLATRTFLNVHASSFAPSSRMSRLPNAAYDWLQIENAVEKAVHSWHDISPVLLTCYGYKGTAEVFKQFNIYLRYCIAHVCAQKSVGLTV